MARKFKKYKSGKLVKLNKRGIPEGATIYPDGSWFIRYPNGYGIGEMVCHAN